MSANGRLLHEKAYSTKRLVTSALLKSDFRVLPCWFVGWLCCQLISDGPGSLHKGEIQSSGRAKPEVSVVYKTIFQVMAITLARF